MDCATFRTLSVVYPFNARSPQASRARAQRSMGGRLAGVYAFFSAASAAGVAAHLKQTHGAGGWGTIVAAGCRSGRTGARAAPALLYLLTRSRLIPRGSCRAANLDGSSAVLPALPSPLTVRTPLTPLTQTRSYTCTRLPAATVAHHSAWRGKNNMRFCLLLLTLQRTLRYFLADASPGAGRTFAWHFLRWLA